MKELILFDDQAEIIGRVREAMKRHKRILLQSSTGSGKTAMGMHMIQRARINHVKSIFTVPRRTLFKQTSDSFKKYGIHHGMIHPSYDFNPFSDVYLAMTDTLAGWIEKGKAPKDIGLVEIDETHFGDKSITTIIENYSQPWLDLEGKKRWTWQVGLSATPQKMSGQGMGIWYDHMECGLQIRELINLKRLSDYRYFYGRPDFQRGGGMVRIDNENDVAEYMEHQGAIIGDAVRDYELRCLGNVHLVRCASIKHSKMTAEAFRNKGHVFVHVDGKMKENELVRILIAYARREIHGLTFADLLNFGFDLQQSTGYDVTVESGSDLKICNSTPSQLQWWGRLLRWKIKPAVMNDHVNNYVTHGLPCSDRFWTLDSLKNRAMEAPPPSKTCPKCMFCHPPAPACPECKYVYPVILKDRSIDEIAGDLHEMDIEAFKAQEKLKKKEPVDGLAELLPPLDDEESLTYLIKYAKQMGYKNPTAWAAQELQKRIMQQQKKYV